MGSGGSIVLKTLLSNSVHASRVPYDAILGKEDAIEHFEMPHFNGASTASHGA